MNKNTLIQIMIAIILISACALLASFLRGQCMFYGHPQWTHIVDKIYIVFFWLLLWRISKSSYKNCRGLSRWIQLSGLLKAFIILLVSSGIVSWAIWSYVQNVVVPDINHMGNIEMAIQDFYEDYQVSPGGNPSPITRDVYDELKGLPDAKVNIRHHDYMLEVDVKSINDRWWRPFWFRIDPNPGFPPTVVLISCGPNGVFENGKGDDFSY